MSKVTKASLEDAISRMAKAARKARDTRTDSALRCAEIEKADVLRLVEVFFQQNIQSA